MRYPIKEIKCFENEFRRKIIIKDKRFMISNYSQAQVIKYLVDNINKDISQKELENVLGIRKSTMSGILDTMEKKNIIKRISSDVDRRSKIIKFSDENIKHHREVVDKMKIINNIITKDISKKDLDIFFEVLDKMRDNLNKEEEEIDKII